MYLPHPAEQYLDLLVLINTAANNLLIARLFKLSLNPETKHSETAHCENTELYSNLPQEIENTHQATKRRIKRGLL